MKIKLPNFYVYRFTAESQESVNSLSAKDEESEG